MSTKTSIAWTDYTWSPWLGCRKVSEGCEHCYITTTTPFRVRHIEHGSQREELSEAYWKQPDRWNRQSDPSMKPRVFPSLCDPFDKEVPLEWKIRFWRLVWRTTNLNWLILTKRPERWEHDWGDMIRAGVIALGSGLPHNVWFGVSVENQKRADERIPILLRIPAQVRFLSIEPMLEIVDLHYSCFNGADSFGTMPGIHWVIFGGESGPKARPCNVEWIRDSVRQCKAARVACFVKQLGSDPRHNYDGEVVGISGPLKEMHQKVRIKNGPLRLNHTKGGDPSEWPEDLRIREFPSL